MLAEGVHFTHHCPPHDVGWKLAAVNLSDLAAMGARPLGMLLGLGVGHGRDARWAAEVARGVAEAAVRFSAPMLGGDTVRLPGAPVLGLTALGHVPSGDALGRAGARPGDDLWVSGTIGDAGLGLQAALGRRAPDRRLLKRYRRPVPRLALGQALRGVATALIDVSDGLLLDASRLADASGVRAVLVEDAIPLSDAARAAGVPPAELAALGDDYELLFAAPPGLRAQVEEAGRRAGVPVTRIGRCEAGEGLALVDGPGAPRPLPPSPGYRH
jgi:thiamine-monophosphate kinase